MDLPNFGKKVMRLAVSLTFAMMNDISVYLKFSPVACAIFAITIAASMYVMNRPELHRQLMLHPYSLTQGSRWYTILTSGFIHADIGHLLLNMITFFFFAFDLESFMVLYMGGSVLAHVVFALVYLLSMGLADISSIFKHKDNPNYYSLGASGAIAGILFSSILFFPGGKIYLFFNIPIPNPIFAVLYLGFSYYAARKQYNNINHEAHLWGAVAGAILTIIFFPAVLPNFIEGVKDLVSGYIPS
jgi:membrane associated rhomboid family serine protease